MKHRLPMMMIAVLFTAAVCTPGSGRDSKSLTISESKNGGGMVVSMSEGLALAILEGAIGSDLECGSDIDGDFATLLHELDREGRGSKATLRDEDGVITARRSGSSLKMKIVDTDDGGRVEVKMPWAVAECMLDGSSTLSSKDAGSIKIKIVDADGGKFEFKVD